MAGLYIVDFNQQGVKAHPKVLQFYEDITKQQEEEKQLRAQKQTTTATRHA